MSVYYNDNDAFCCEVLESNIARGHLPPGDVDNRDIREVQADEIRGYDAWHLFAGIGGFPLGLRMAGWPDDGPRIDRPANLLYPDDTGGDLMPPGAKRNPKYDAAVDLYQSGMSIADCGDYFGITRQAMHKILQRRGVSFRSNLKYGEENHFHRDGATMSKRAGHLVEKAIKRGVLVPEACEICGAAGTMADGRRLVQAHHDDYSKPLVVRWLCQEHHHEWHKHNRAKGVEGEPVPVGLTVLTGGFP